MSAFGGKADLIHGLAECLLLAKSGHYMKRLPRPDQRREYDAFHVSLADLSLTDGYPCGGQPRNGPLMGCDGFCDFHRPSDHPPV